jgi:hypothetical protein
MNRTFAIAGYPTKAVRQLRGGGAGWSAQAGHQVAGADRDDQDAHQAADQDVGQAVLDPGVGASVSLAPSPLAGATGRAETCGSGLNDPNSSSTVTPSGRAKANATRSDGSEKPDSTAEMACRDTPAIAASCCSENPRACRASRSR